MQSFTQPLFFSILSATILHLHANHILNGDFEAEIIDNQSDKKFSILFPVSHWKGYFELIGSSYTWAMGFGQYCDMAAPSTGYLEQNVTIPADNEYIFAWKQKPQNNSLTSCAIQIHWNGNYVATSPATSTDVVQCYIFIQATAGVNLLRLEEVGYPGDGLGMSIDDFCLQTVLEGGCSLSNSSINISPQLQRKPKNIQQKDNEFDSLQKGLSKLHTFPVSQFKGLKYLGIFIDDMWLYIYDSRSYNGTIQEIFQATNQIQKLKWTLLNYVSFLSINSNSFAFSDFCDFSNPRHMKIDGVDALFVRNTYSFLFFTIPQMIVLCGILKGVFHLLFKYKISTLFRRYSFYFPSSFQILFEGNVAYMTFIALNQMRVAFAFKFVDKLSIATCVLFFGLMLIGSFCFYGICNQIYSKQFGYFLYCVYRENKALLFLTVKFFVRGTMGGVIHHFLSEHYGVQIFLLCTTDASIVLLALILEKTKGIFLTKSMFLTVLFYHTNFILFNVSLYLEQYIKHKNDQEAHIVLIDIQEKLIFVQVFFVVILCLLDILPLRWFAPSEEEDDNQVQVVINPVQDNQQNSEKEKCSQQKAVKIEDINSVESDSFENVISKFKLSHKEQKR